MSLTDEVMGSVRLAKVFHDCTSPVTSLEFSGDGEALLAASAEDESIHLYDALLGKSQKMVYSKKYGVGLVRFTHRSTNVVYSSAKGDATLRYLSLHDNAYLRYFAGHTQRVTALEMSPLSDCFLSGAADDSVRVWDLRTAECQGVMEIKGKPLVAVDPQGVVFAVALDSRLVRLYDMKNYESVRGAPVRGCAYAGCRARLLSSRWPTRRARARAGAASSSAPTARTC